MLLCTEGTKIRNKTKSTPQFQNAVGTLSMGKSGVSNSVIFVRSCLLRFKNEHLLLKWLYQHSSPYRIKYILGRITISIYTRSTAVSRGFVLSHRFVFLISKDCNKIDQPFQ